MYSREMTITEPFLHIPIRTGAPKTALQLWLGGRLLYDFAVELAGDDPQFYSFLDVRAFTGCRVELILPEPGALAPDSLDRLVNGGPPAEGHPLYPQLYREALRPQFHFSSRRGWLNDPNGLLFCNGLYHLYYQHNPFGTLHAGVNVSWGHAVSTDLVHWTERADAILPWRRDWLIASGSALLDAGNAAGYGAGAIIAAFTCLGTPREDGAGEYPAGGQFLAASTDGGDSFVRFSHQATVPAEHGASWRDPRLFAYRDHFMMAVYEVHNGVNGVSFYRSRDLHTWELTGWNGNLYECPDIFPLPVEGGGEEKWVLFGADGLARIGTFTGDIFVDEGLEYPLDYGTSTYAGQTWNHEPGGRRVHISWVRGMGDPNGWDRDMGYHGMPFSQCMTVPTTLTLRKVNGQTELYRYPIKELESLRLPEPAVSSMALNASADFRLEAGTDTVYTLKPSSPELTIAVAGQTIRFAADKGLLIFPDGKERQMPKGDLTLRVLVDRTTVELFFGDGVAATYALDTRDESLTLHGEGALDICRWQLRSVW